MSHQAKVMKLRPSLRMEASGVGGYQARRLMDAPVSMHGDHVGGGEDHRRADDVERWREQNPGVRRSGHRAADELRGAMSTSTSLRAPAAWLIHPTSHRAIDRLISPWPRMAMMMMTRIMMVKEGHHVDAHEQAVRKAAVVASQSDHTARRKGITAQHADEQIVRVPQMTREDVAEDRRIVPNQWAALGAWLDGDVGGPWDRRGDELGERGHEDDHQL